MKIAVVGIGYVGLSIACLLAQKNEVIALDVVKEKVDMINKGKSPIRDKEIEDFLANKKLDLKATLDYKEAFKEAKFIIISTQINYDDATQSFDTSYVEDIIEKVISMNIDTTMVIASTKVGYNLPKEEAIDFSGKSAGICYLPDTLETLFAELTEKTQRRVN